MSVVCKFVCQSITRQLGYVYKDGKSEMKEVNNVRFSVVTSGSDENKEFFAATPSGSIEFSYVHPVGFELGKEYYVEIKEHK